MNSNGQDLTIDLTLTDPELTILLRALVAHIDLVMTTETLSVKERVHRSTAAWKIVEETLDALRRLTGNSQLP